MDVIALDELRGFCRGKRIAIVGNSRILLARGEIIDGHDIVVRMNRGYPGRGHAQFTGQRTDIWCPSGISNTADLIKYSKLFQEHYKLWFHGVWSRIHPAIRHNLFVESPRHFAALWRRVGAYPSTGCATLDFFVREIDCESISV